MTSHVHMTFLTSLESNGLKGGNVGVGVGVGGVVFGDWNDITSWI